MLKKSSIYGISLLLLLNACQTREPVKPATSMQTRQTPVRFANAGQASTYRNYHLEQIGKMALGLSLQPESRALLYKKIEQQFDGDYNVLVETLLKEGEPYQLTKKTTDFLQNDDWQNSVEAFKQGRIEIADDLFPQIYIPFYEELQQKHRLNVKSPVIAVSPVSEADTVLHGFTLNEKGQIVQVSTPVTEAFAQGNEVWIISFNENMRKGKLVSSENLNERQTADWVNIQPGLTCGDPTVNTNGRSTSAGLNVIIPNMTIRCHKEPWHSGRTEVRMLATTGYCSGVTSQGVPNDRGYWEGASADAGGNQYADNEIGVWRRKEVNDKQEKWVDFSVTDFYNYRNKTDNPLDWGETMHPQYGSDGRLDCMFYVIYENDVTDAWEKKPRAYITSTGFDGNGSNRMELAYSSNDSYFVAGYWNWYKNHEKYPCGLEYDDGCIKVNVTVAVGQ
jgi:hypothetical protein